MRPVILTVICTVSPDDAPLRPGVSPALPDLAGIEGLALAIRGVDPDAGTGVSACLFADEESAKAFAEGPVLWAMRAHPAVSRVDVQFAPVEPSCRSAADAALVPTLSVA